MEPPDLGFDLVASSLRADSRDLKTFVEVLARKLEAALPAETTVERRGGGLFSRERHVNRIQIALGDNRFDLAAEGARLETSCARAVRGIVLKNDQVSLDEWIDRLSAELAAHARNNEQARLALERLLQG
jgi:hypothetical protein